MKSDRDKVRGRWGSTKHEVIGIRRAVLFLPTCLTRHGGARVVWSNSAARRRQKEETSLTSEVADRLVRHFSN